MKYLYQVQVAIVRSRWRNRRHLDYWEMQCNHSATWDFLSTLVI